MENARIGTDWKKNLSVIFFVLKVIGIRLESIIYAQGKEAIFLPHITATVFPVRNASGCGNNIIK